MKRKVTIYDTTLRDGAQGEGVSFSSVGKLMLAKRLDQFGVDYIEGGFPGSNPKDIEFFEAIRKEELQHAKIAAFGSTRRVRSRVQDDVNVKSLLAAETPVVTIFGKTWKLHVKDVLRTSLKENLAMVSDTVAYLKSKGKEVIFDAEHLFDGFKDDPDFAMSVLQAAESAGADHLVLCDTNGGCLPHEIFEITQGIVSTVHTPIGIHAHNDIGVGVANAIEGVRAGATQVQGTMNGYGERCGNANLISIIPSLKLKLDVNCCHARKLRHLRDLSMFVDDQINVRHDTRAPYVGRSAFGHKGGAHVNAVQKNPATFEHIEPETVGNERHILISEHSGGSSILLKAIEVGAGGEAASKEDTAAILKELKSLEHKGYAYESADASFRILVQKVLKKHKPFFELDGFRVTVEKSGKDAPCVSEATVKVRVRGEIEHTVAEGDGPVNALDSALRKALKGFYPEIANVHLSDFRVRILDPQEATAATTRVQIESGDGVDTWGTVGVSENIIEASWEALVDSVEYKLFAEESKKS
ncbi:MAG: citramalate synthase [Verrucomicrobia bacterium]|jgi:2-isopropylmalate synthase|nr:citramalate synthase [Verrucomicrobiota bacterium]